MINNNFSPLIGGIPCPGAYKFLITFRQRVFPNNNLVMDSLSKASPHLIIQRSTLAMGLDRESFFLFFLGMDIQEYVVSHLDKVYHKLYSVDSHMIT